MDRLFKTRLSSQEPLTTQCIQRQLITFGDVCLYVQQLPYGRLLDRKDYDSILIQQKGTCSSKHAFLAALAKENSIKTIDLYIGIYRMNDINTKGIGSVLKDYNLEYIPEAHTYLKYKEQRLDFTKSGSTVASFEDYLLDEMKILPPQIGDHKVDVHQNFLKEWIKTNRIPFSFNEIWRIRELCIANLSL